MRLMSRDPEDLLSQTCGRHHDYPDGFALYLGSLIAPTGFNTFRIQGRRCS